MIRAVASGVKGGDDRAVASGVKGGDECDIRLPDIKFGISKIWDKYNRHWKPGPMILFSAFFDE